MSPQSIHSVEPGHISTVSVGYPGSSKYIAPDPDGICHCNNPPAPSAIGECPKCYRLVPR